jgi:hypothetical protein
MRLYFDSNVYARISERDETEAVRHWLVASKHSLLVSDVNRDEAYRIPDDLARTRRFTTIAGLATEQTQPGAFLDSREVRGEIRRVHPNWLRRTVSQSAISHFLNGDRRFWRMVRQEPESVPRHPLYDSLLAEGAGKVLNFQKSARSMRQKLGRDSLGFVGDTELTIQWRLECAEVWWLAVFEGEPLMRDYKDYLGPFLRPKSIDREAWMNFWLGEVDAYAVPRNKLISLAYYFQLRHRPTAGNASDARHATHMLGTEAFVTADRSFHKVLTDLLPMFDKLARPVLLDPKLDLVEELARGIT